MLTEKIKISKIITEKIKLSKLKINPDNPRIIRDEEYLILLNSVKTSPWMLEVNSIKIDKDFTVLAGNQRVKACRELKMKEVFVTNLGHLTKEQQQEYIIKDNKHYGEWNYSMLSEWDNEQLKEWGIEGLEEEEIKGLIEDDYIPEVKESKVKRGDIWQLGEHRIMCGDSTSSDDVAKLMNGEKADISFTSPPYNAGKNIRGYFYENDNDNKSNEDYIKFLYDFTINTIKYSKFSFVNIQMLEGNKTDIIEYQYKLKNYLKDILIWNKNIAPPHINKGTFATKWEYVLSFSENKKGRAFPCSWQGKFTNVIETENASANNYANIHKATFPISFPSWIIEKMDFAKSVLDVFMGTGTTLIAAEKLNRKCYGMELDQKYCDVIIERWEQFTGQTAVKEEIKQLV